jgi:hypothetical protein
MKSDCSLHFHTPTRFKNKVLVVRTCRGVMSGLTGKATPSSIHRVIRISLVLYCVRYSAD